MAAGKLSPFGISIGQEVENGLDEIVATSSDAIHVVLLVLHRSDEGRIGQVDCLGDPSAGGTEQLALRLRGAINDVVRRAEEFPK